ncbi:zinc finger protein 37-like isoform X2 [Leguminivora glycinivorella]|uniref:zinc finger protein 37-like isoform X2 n=1 Tax=Leguminivora glycinivorella TaxID=1035111 RepID=UPI00200C74D1|nr:zinc finger protein 37-like isoform X2 [Leguminivora glycinivorella]
MDGTQNKKPLLCCRACLSAGGKLFNIHEYKLTDAFTHITGITVDKERLPQHLCVYCSTQLLKSVSFRDMCWRTQQHLNLDAEEKLTLENVRKINSSNQYLDLTLTEIQTIECMDVPSTDTAIEFIDTPPTDATTHFIETTIDSVDTPADTTIDGNDSTDIDLPLNDIDPEGVNVTLEPNFDFTNVDDTLKKYKTVIKTNNRSGLDIEPMYFPLLGTGLGHSSNSNTNVETVGDDDVNKTEPIMIYENINPVLNVTNEEFRKSSLKPGQADSNIKRTDTKIKNNRNQKNKKDNSDVKIKENKKQKSKEDNSDTKIKENRKQKSKKDNSDTKIKENKKQKIIKLARNVKHVGVDGIIKKSDLKVEYENQKQVLNISKDKLQYIKDRMRTIGASIKKKMQKEIGENSANKDIKISIETKKEVEVDGVSDVNIIRMPIKMKVDNLKENALKKRIDMKMMMMRCRKIRKKMRRVPLNNYLPWFDYAQFEKDFEVKIMILNKEEQLQEIVARKSSRNYLESPFRCESCGKGFNAEAAFNNHTNRHSPSVGAFPCEICALRFRSNGLRHSHEDTHKLKFTCSLCGFVTRMRYMARNHHAMHKGETFPCRHCGKTFLKPTSCLTHMRLAHPTLNVSCNQCGETFVGDFGLRLHQNKAHGKKRQEFKCHTCSANFLNEEALKRHTESAGEHNDKDLRPCEQCGENCASETQLQEHVEKAHPKETYRCDECDISFIDTPALETHIQRNHIGKGYAPSDRRRRAEDRKHLYLWRKKHVPEKPTTPNNPNKPTIPTNKPQAVVCDQCGRFMKSQTVFRHHILRDHQNVKPYACNECPMKFFNKGNLQIHLRKHTGERPFQCPDCPLAFSFKANLYRHQKTAHLGIRDSFPCAICDRTYTTKASLTTHVNTVHCGRPWPRRDRSKRPKTKGQSAETTETTTGQ